VSPSIARRIEQDHPEIRTAPFGNAEFHDPKLAAGPTASAVGPAVVPAAGLETTEDDR
jgi:hypothetical protein